MRHHRHHRGGSRWRPVEKALIKRLADRSAGRVAKSERFGEIREKLAKLKKSADLIKLADVLDETRDEDDEDDDLHSNKETLSPQAEEALEILADTITLGVPEPEARLRDPR